MHFLTKRTARQWGARRAHTNWAPPWAHMVASAEVLLHSILPTHPEILGPDAHRTVSSLSLEGKKQNLDGQGTVLWVEPLPGR